MYGFEVFKGLFIFFLLHSYEPSVIESMEVERVKA